MQAAWNEINWNNYDSIEVSGANIPTWLDGLKKLGVRPRYTLAQRDFTRDSLTTGIGVPTGVYHFNVTAQGTGGSTASEVILRSVYAKRYD
jgi:Tfp pilus assembly protein PilX